MKLIDISHELNENTPSYPGDHQLKLSEDKKLNKDSCNTFLLSSGLHTGTHIDVPMHMTGDKRTAADFPLEKFTGKGVLLDVRGENIISMKPRYERSIPEDSVVLLFTGFDKYYGTNEYFSKHPEVSIELGEFLINKNIRMLGMDIPSPDRFPFIFHKTLLNRDIILLENLTNLEKLLGTEEFEVMAFPLKISAEASFVRAVCRVY